MVTLLRLAACSVPLLIGLTSRCFVPQFTMVALQRLTACNAPLFIGLPLRLFRALRAAKLRPTGRALRAPPPLPPSIRNGRSASSHRARLRRRGVPWLRTALRFVCSPLQPFGPPMCAKRTSGPPTSQFSMVAPHRSQAHSRCSLLHWAHRRLLHPQFAMVVLLRPTACSTPLLIGLTTACFAHCARPSCAPLAAPPLSPSLGLLRAASFHNSQ